jgi:hypothetical protein
MQIIMVNNDVTPLQIADPAPNANRYVLQLNPGEVRIFEISEDVFARIYPTLRQLESEYVPSLGMPRATWIRNASALDYVSGETFDMREINIPAYIGAIHRASPGKISLAAGGTTNIAITGISLIDGIVRPSVTIGTTGGIIKYHVNPYGASGEYLYHIRHVKPGPSTALSVNVNYTRGGTGPVEVTVTLGTDGGGAVTSTAAAVAAAVSSATFGFLYPEVIQSGIAQVAPDFVFTTGGVGPGLTATFNGNYLQIEQRTGTSYTAPIPAAFLSGLVAGDVAMLSLWFDFTIVYNFPITIVA